MPADLEDDHKVLYDLCTELHRERGVSPATHARAIASLGEQATMDAIGICGYYAFLAMVLNTPRAIR
jgi:4-carboxymuconolactone decarboxylase